MATNPTCEQILRDLKYCDGEFPEAAIQAARQNRDEIIPGLMATIHEATNKSDDGEIVATWGHIAALMLLTEFNAKEAFPVILLSMCSARAESLYEDFITEDLKHIAARLAEGPEQLALAINDEDVYEYVRGALVEAVFGMVCEQRISREEAISFLRDRLKTAIQEQDTHVVTKTVEILGRLLAKEALSDVRAAEKADLVDEDWIGANYFDEQLARGQAGFEEVKADYLKYDKNISIDNLRRMPWFNQKPPANQTLDGVLDEISSPFSRLPQDAVRWARKHPEEITPHLIQIIRNVPDYARLRSSDSDVPESYAHIVALYLLLEFGNREILPILLNLLIDPDPDVVDCFADVINGDLAQILGRLADEPDQLMQVISNHEVNEFVRRDAIESVVWMVTEGKLDRNQAITLLLGWLKESRKAEDTTLTTWFTLTLMELGASESCQMLVEAFDAGEIEDGWICVEDIEDALSNGNNTFSETLESHHVDRIEHTVVELSTWDWDSSRSEDMESDDDWYDDSDDEGDDLSTNEDFRKLWLRMREQFSPEQLMEFVESGVPLDRRDMEYADDASYSDVTPPIRLDSPKIGRNDPCPCGSGKKYKKCCAKAAT